MDDDGGSRTTYRKGQKDRTSCLITGMGIGMLVALVTDNIWFGFALGVLIGLGMEAAAKKGFRLFRQKQNMLE